MMVGGCPALEAVAQAGTQNTGTPALRIVVGVVLDRMAKVQVVLWLVGPRPPADLAAPKPAPTAEVVCMVAAVELIKVKLIVMVVLQLIAD
jgi:hypothetical protein